MICQTPVFVPNKNFKFDNRKDQFISVPCGVCGICLSNRRQEWSIRILEESKIHDYTSFITLTYDNDSTLGNLNKKDFQDFIKRLRHKLKFRYYCVGEYGTKTFRPHYHVMLFGYRAGSNDSVIEKEWGHGFVYVKPYNIRRAWYITKYHVNRGAYPHGLEPPFTLMSTKPPIGINYVDRMYDYHRQDLKAIYYSDFDKKRTLPRIFRERIYNKVERYQVFSKYQQVFEKQEMLEARINSKYYRQRQANVDATNNRYREKSKYNAAI